MPRPKHTPGQTRPAAVRQFTDREEFVEAFEKAISEFPLEDNKVLVYYGVGGIGKTSLRKELGRLLEEEHPEKVAWAVLDFETQPHRDVEGALSWLSKEEMGRKYKVPFPSFELALFEYRRKSLPYAPTSRDEMPLLAEGGTIADLVSLGADIPGVSIAAKGVKLTLKTREYLKGWWTKRGQPLLYELQGMTPKEIEERLPMFWAEDLKAFMQRQLWPVVLFVDTYEALWEGQRSDARFFLRDEWMRELVAQLPEVLWVIGGREKLRWEEVDPDWGSCLEQHLVGRLAQEDARKFLSSCEVSGEVIQEAIVEGSEGVPFYLDLAVDTYLESEKKGRDPVPADFEGTPREVLDRFLRHLEESEEETLKVLSVARFWDRSLFRLLIDEFKTGYPATALPKLCRFSFIQEGQVSGTWTIHPLMREGLEEHQAAELRREIHQYLFNHYNQQLEGLEITAISVLHRAALTEAFHHGRQALDTVELLEWFITAGDVFERAALWQFLTPLYEVLIEVVEDSLDPDHPRAADSPNNLANLYYQQGRYEEAEQMYKRALGIWEQALGSYHPDTADSLNNLANLYEEQGRYEEAEQMYKRALGIWEQALGPDHPRTADSLVYLANLYQSKRQHRDAEAIYRRALRIQEKKLGRDHPDTIRTRKALEGLEEN